MKITLEQIVMAGIHFGHPSCYWHPIISNYTYGVRNGIHIIDLVKTRQELKKELNLLKVFLLENVGWEEY